METARPETDLLRGIVLNDLLDGLADCQVFDLGHALAPGMPIAPTHPPYTFTLQRRHGDQVREDGISTANELLVLAAHTGTHVDAVGHASRDGRLHGGLVANEEERGGLGLRQLGAERLDPVVCRGVVLDAARAAGRGALDPAHEITLAEVRAAEELAGVRVRPGDAVLFRTGWTQHWSDPQRYVGIDTGTPGPGPEVADWLVDKGVRITGSDTLVYEVVRPDRNVRPVHGRLLVDAGIAIIEALDLEAITDAGVSECIFVMSPLKLVGATASPIRPLALVPVARRS